MLVNGQWSQAWHPFQKTNTQGEFLRQPSSFRHWVTPNGESGPSGEAGFKAESGRYHLYVALICPWASRALMVRALKGLESVISVSVVEPALSDQGWRFASLELSLPGAEKDPLYGAKYVHEIYTRADPHFTGRVTVPILWDKQRQTIVNNESADIIQMLDHAFEPWAKKHNALQQHSTLRQQSTLRPHQYLTEMAYDHAWLYENFNNAVYQAGFAQSQQAYHEAVMKVFTALTSMEQRLSDGRLYWYGDALTETDVRAFVTLVRFDVAYHGLFKCNKKRVSDFKYVQAYMERIYDLEGVAATVDMNHIKQGYYSIAALNPSKIVPLGPDLPWIRG